MRIFMFDMAENKGIDNNMTKPHKSNENAFMSSVCLISPFRSLVTCTAIHILISI